MLQQGAEGMLPAASSMCRFSVGASGKDENGHVQVWLALVH